MDVHAVLVWLYPFFRGLVVGSIAMILHECGHIVAAIALGVRVKKVGVQWTKGIYTIRERGTLQQNILIALAGPGVNLLLVLLEPWFPEFGLANVCCVLANMLPFRGSDGYRVATCWRDMRLSSVMK